MYRKVDMHLLISVFDFIIVYEVLFYIVLLII